MSWAAPACLYATAVGEAIYIAMLLLCCCCHIKKGGGTSRKIGVPPTQCFHNGRKILLTIGLAVCNHVEYVDTQKYREPVSGARIRNKVWGLIK